MTEQEIMKKEIMKKVKKVLKVFKEKFRQGEYPDRKLPILFVYIYVYVPNKKTFVIDSLTFATEKFLNIPVGNRHNALENMSQEEADHCVYLPVTGQMYDAKEDIVNALIAEGISEDCVWSDFAYDD